MDVDIWLAKAAAGKGPFAHVHNGVMAYDGTRAHYYRRMGTGCPNCPGSPGPEVGPLIKAGWSTATENDWFTAEVRERLSDCVLPQHLDDALSGFEEPAEYWLSESLLYLRAGPAMAVFRLTVCRT